MPKSLYIGMDVNKISISVAVAEDGRDIPVRFLGSIPNTPADIAKLAKRLAKEGRLEFGDFCITPRKGIAALTSVNALGGHGHGKQVFFVGRIRLKLAPFRYHSASNTGLGTFKAMMLLAYISDMKKTTDDRDKYWYLPLIFTGVIVVAAGVLVTFFAPPPLPYDIGFVGIRNDSARALCNICLILASPVGEATLVVVMTFPAIIKLSLGVTPGRRTALAAIFSILILLIPAHLMPHYSPAGCGQAQL